MKPRKAREVASALRRKGFQHRRDGDHHRYVLYVEGRKTSIRTKLSHGAQECDPFVLQQMARGLRLSSLGLGDLLDCPLTQDAYVQLLVSEGWVRL